MWQARMNLVLVFFKTPRPPRCSAIGSAQLTGVWSLVQSRDVQQLRPLVTGSEFDSRQSMQNERVCGGQSGTGTDFSYTRPHIYHASRHFS
jgi:hypothetical protein